MRNYSVTQIFKQKNKTKLKSLSLTFENRVDSS